MSATSFISNSTITAALITSKESYPKRAFFTDPFQKVQISKSLNNNGPYRISNLPF